MYQTDKMEKVELRAVIKHLYKKGMSLREIQEGFMEPLGKGSPSYSTVKKWALNLVGGWGVRALKMMNDLGTPKKLPQMKTLKLFTVWLCVTGGKTCET